MDPVIHVLKEVAAGKKRFTPASNRQEDLNAFEMTAQAILAAERRGYIEKALPHHRSTRGGRVIDFVQILEGLTHEGRERLAASKNEIHSQRPILSTPTEMRDHSSEEIQSAIFDLLSGREKASLPLNQFSSLEDGVREVLSRREGLHDGNPVTRNFALLSTNDRETFFEVFQYLKQEGIIRDGLNRDNPGPPFFQLTKKGMKAINELTATLSQPTVEVQLELRESLAHFLEDYPDGTRVGFIMMRFGKTPAHQKITATIKSVLQQHGIDALRADDKEYHEDLFANIKTYMHACTFGIAVLERLEGDEFNPNVSLEIGYLMALRKPVLLLKDQTLKSLPTDLVGKLYRSFDPQDIPSTIEREINCWLRDKKLTKRSAEHATAYKVG